MTYKILSHPADLSIRVKGESLKELFIEAMRGMMTLIKGDFEKKPVYEEEKVERKISLESLDRTTLLVDFLSEILTMSHINKEIYLKVNFKTFSENNIDAVLEGIPVESFDEDIKAVTYHGAEIKQNEKGEWEVTLIFDI